MNDKLKLRSVEIAYALFKPTEHEHRVFVACLCWRKNRLVQVGINQDKTHPINARYNPLICRRTGRIITENKGVCAELDCFLNLKKKTNYNFRDLSIINVRIDRKMEIKNSRPCSSCSSLINYVSPRELWYSTGGVKDNPEFELY